MGSSASNTDLQAKRPQEVAKTELESDKFWPLSGKPYFDVVLTKSHVRPLYQMLLPPKIRTRIPNILIPVTLTYGGRDWKMLYNGTHKTHKKFDNKWRNFVIDNDLKVGDACVLELIECSSEKLKFRVQILRGDIPSGLLNKVRSADSVIVID